MIPVALLVLASFAVDMILTYQYVKYYKEKYPKNDWTLAEANPILRAYFKAFDLNKGMIYGTFTIFVILVIILVYVSNSFRWFLFGFYTATNIHHFANWNALKSLKTKEIK